MRARRVMTLMFIVVLMLMGGGEAFAKILIVGPHPDDEAMMFSGVIYGALSRGEPVKVVMMTNGDMNSISEGNTRQGETVSALAGSLGMQESDIIFLGYPDSGLTPIYNSYTQSTDAYTAQNGQSATYAQWGLGRSDYHYYKFGSHAAYNKPNILTDLESIITDFMPDHIFVTSQYDQHPDHAIEYSYVRDALTAISATNATYKPVIHKTIIHGGDDTAWPLRMNPVTDFTTPPLLSSTPLLWSNRESIHLPSIMLSDLAANNLKYNTILKYNSALAPYPNPQDNYITSFVHRDEVFWADNVYSTNAPPVANAGQDQTVNELTTVFLDGSSSVDPGGNPLTYQWTQLQGPAVTLSNPTSPSPSFVSPSGLAAAQTLVFQLTVYDGQIYSFPDTVVITVISASQYANIAPHATVTASSENSSTGQLAVKVIDGIIGGCPNNCGAEWATLGELAGAWLNLAWPQSYIVNKIVLYDRPNLNDQILNATLTFSDGSSITAGPLTNDGSGDTYTFPAKTVNSVKLTVNQANGSNTGLAEIQVFGNASPSLAVTTISPPSGVVGASYSQPLSGTGGQPPYTWSITSGTLPAGLTLAASTGVLSGTPTATGTTTFTVQIKDASLTTATKPLSLTVNAQPAVSTTSLSAGGLSTPYSQTLAATGGQTPYTWSVSSGTLPAGFILTPSSGTISGTPTATGTSTFTVQVKDANQTAATKSLSITINQYAPLVISTASLPYGTTGTAYSQTLAATGGKTPYTWSISSGTLPAGLTLNGTTGVISGTPTTAGTSSFTVRVKDATATTATKTLSLTVYAPVAVATAALPNGIVGVAYSQTLAATGGQTPYTWSVYSGALPTGLSLNITTGVISGIPTAAGSKSFTVRVQDAAGTTATKTLTITISPNQPPVATNDAYTTNANTILNQAAPGVLSNDSDPEGAPLAALLVSGPSHGTLTLNPNGSFVYTPLTDYVGSDSFTYVANDGMTNSAVATVTIAVVSTGGVLLSDDFMRASGAPLPLSPWTSALGTWTVDNGVLQGTGSPMAYSHLYDAPTPLWGDYVVKGSFQFAAQAFGGGLGCRVNPATGAQYSAWIFPDNSVVGPNVIQLVKQWTWTTYSGTAMAQASIPPVGTGWHDLKMVCNGSRIQVFYDGTLKIDVTDNNYDGRAPYLTGGIDVGMGTFNTVYAMSVDSVTVNAYTQLSVGTASLATGTVGAAYSQTLAATGGVAPYTWSVSSGTLPAGLTLAASTGVISGTPTIAGTSSFTVQVQDAAGMTATRPLSLTIYGPLAVSTTTLASGTTGTAYSQTLAAAGGLAPYTWSVSSGALPAGLTLAASTGVISGTPTATGTSTFTVQVKDANNTTATKTLSLAIYGPLSVSTTSLTYGTVGAAYSQTLAATGGVAPYTWSVSSGSLPAGLTLAASGVISGTPTTAGTSSFTVQVQDANSTTATKTLSLVIYAPLSVSTASLATGTAGATYSQTLAATGGVAPYTWSVSSGTLPAGLTLAASTGVISGTPTTAGTISFTAQVQDAAGTSATKTLTITISAIQPPVATNDAYATNVNTTLNQAAPGVLSNDSDPQGWTLTALLVSGPSHGTLTLNSNGSFVYTPLTGYVGNDSFTYMANNGTTSSAVATVTITVGTLLFSDDFSDASLSPWTVALGTWTISNGVLQGSGSPMAYSHLYDAPTPLWGDYVVEGSFQFAAQAFGGGLGCRVNPATGAQYSAWIFPDNSVVGPNVIQLVKQWTWTTYSGTEMAQASIPAVGTGWHDLKMVCNGSRIQVFYDGTLKIDVTDNNYDGRAPYLTGGIDVGMGTFNTVFTMSVDSVTVNAYTQLSVGTASLATGTVGAAYSQTLAATGGVAPYTWSVSSGTLPAGLTLAASTGVISGTPTTAGTISFTAQVQDATGMTATKSLTITISANQSPIAANDAYVTTANATLNQAAPGVLANDTDPEGAPLTAQLVNGPSHGTLTLNTNGSFVYTPTTNYTGSDSFTYSARDGTLASGVATAAITVNAAEHTISTWRGNKAGAVTFTFDDGYLSEYSVGVTALNEQGYKGTFFVITDAMNNSQPDMATWDNWRTAASAGHEIGSHTKSHPYLTTLSTDQMQDEIVGSKAEIDTRIPTQKTLSFAYPYGDMNDNVESVAAGAYLAARGTTWGLNASPIDQYNLKAFFITDNTGKPLESQVDLAVSSGQWLIAGFHGLDGTGDGAVTEARFRQFVDYVKTKSVWVDTLGAVTKYVEEREHATLSVMSSTGDGVVLSLSDGLDDGTYNEPLTIRSEVPATCSSALVAQGTSYARVSAVQEGSETVIYYDAIPDQGQIAVIYNPPDVSALTLSPGSVIGGTGAQGTIALSGPAPGGGALITLSDDSAATVVPAAVTVPAGSTTASFDITTTPVASAATATISAVYGGGAKTALLTVSPPTLSTLTVNPTSVKGGTSSQGTIILNGPAPSGGVVVSLSDNSAYASVPASITVVSGSTNAVFTVTTSAVLSNRTATITATYGGVQKTATLSITR